MDIFEQAAYWVADSENLQAELKVDPKGPF
jgi:hypothetical protein